MQQGEQRHSAESSDNAAERFWDEHYLTHARPWSGVANATVVEVASRLPIGRSLDLGCGNGGDPIWLAQQGWQATGVDVSGAVLDVARAKAAEFGPHDQVDF